MKKRRKAVAKKAAAKASERGIKLAKAVNALSQSIHRVRGDQAGLIAYRDVLQLELATPFHTPGELLGTLIGQLLLEPDVLASARLWIVVADEVAHWANRYVASNIPDVRHYLQVVADLTIERRFVDLSAAMLTEGVAPGTDITPDMVNSAMRSGFFGDKSETLRRWFCSRFQLQVDEASAKEMAPDWSARAH